MVPVLLFTGFRILNREDFGRIGWDILTLRGGGLSLGVAIKSSGLADWVLALLNVGGASPVVLTLLLTFIATVATTFISTTYTAALLLPFVAGLAPHPAVPVVAVAIGVSVSMVPSVSTPPDAITCGPGLVKARTMARLGIVLSAVALFVVVFGVMGLAKLLGYR